MATKYPAQIDTVIELPMVVDNKTIINSITVNRLRDAIVAIESELGIKPSGIYGNTKERLDVIETTLDNFISQGGDITISGDLSGTHLTQKVIGLQNYPISTAAPLAGQFLKYDGSRWIPATIVIPDSLILTFEGPKLLEVNDIINGPIFTATYDHAPTTAVLIDSDGNPSQDVIGGPSLFQSANSFQKNTYGANVVFTLTAGDGTITEFKTFTLYWGQNVFFGVGSAGSSGEGFIHTLDSILVSSLSAVFTVFANPTDKIYFAHRTGYGTATFMVDGFTGGFTKTSSTISVTNTFGYTENYSLYESDNLGLGDTTVLVSQS